jgi:hypothetical protein
MSRGGLVDDYLRGSRFFQFHLASVLFLLLCAQPLSFFLDGYLLANLIPILGAVFSAPTQFINPHLSIDV